MTEKTGHEIVLLELAKLLQVKLIFCFKSLKIFWMNDKAIIEFGVRGI